MQQVAPPALARPRQVGDFVAQSGGDQDPPSPQGHPVGQPDLEPGIARGRDPGEAVEFDTLTPHWFGSSGLGPVEVLSIFGRPGERMRMRSAAAARSAVPADPRVG